MLNGFDAKDGSGVSPREIARAVFPADGWEEREAEIERLRTVDVAEVVNRHRAAERERDSLRDLCDELASALETVWWHLGSHACGLGDDEVNKAEQIIEGVLAEYHERRGTKA